MVVCAKEAPAANNIRDKNAKHFINVLFEVSGCYKLVKKMISERVSHLDKIGVMPIIIFGIQSADRPAVFQRHHVNVVVVCRKLWYWIRSRHQRHCRDGIGQDTITVALRITTASRTEQGPIGKRTLNRIKRRAKGKNRRLFAWSAKFMGGLRFWKSAQVMI
jgi:drug/metabolite transporter superfamily protein YnfA